MAALIVAKQRLVFSFCVVLVKNFRTNQSKSFVYKLSILGSLIAYKVLFLPFGSY